MKASARQTRALLQGVPLAPHSQLLEETADHLTQCKYFQTMSKDVLRLVLKASDLLELPAGINLIRQGERDDDMFFLLEGSLAVMSGNMLILRLNNPGDVAGEFAVVSSSERSADVVTEVPSRVVRVPTGFVKRWSVNPKLVVEFYTVFAHFITSKLRETSARARLYETAVLEAQEMADSHNKLESEIKDKLQEITLYSKVIQSSTAAVVITDVDGSVVNTNQAAADLLEGLDITFSGGEFFPGVVTGYNLGTFRDHALGTPWAGEWTPVKNTAAPVLRVTVTPIHDRDINLANVAFQLEDISLQKEQEQAIDRKNEEVRNALLDLEATYQELQRGDQLKAETLGAISAELAAPVRRILNHTGKIQTTRSEMSREELDEHLGVIHEQTEYLKVISENVNYLIDLQAEFQALSVEPFDLRDILVQALAKIEPWGERKNITIEQNLPDEPLPFNGDQGQVLSVFTLLLEQAMLLSRAKGKIQIDGRIKIKEDQVELEVRYPGPTFKDISPTSEQFQGRMGLLIGLPLSRKVISQYQGTLEFGGTHKNGTIKIVLPSTPVVGDERPNRVLIMDDKDMDRMITKGVIDHLWPEAEIVSTADPFEFLDSYEDFAPDLVIIDPHLSQPGWVNHRVLASLMQTRRHTCPILSVSTLYKDFAERTIAVERGVADFLEKPYSIFDLRFKVKSLLQTHRKEVILHNSMDQVQKQALTDGLTKLANRKHFDDFIATQMEYSRQTGKPLSMILLDVDNFKHYNDTNGHQLGDEVLRTIGRVLALSVRSSDLAARYGGEEFTIVLPETRKEMAAVVAEKVRRMLLEEDFPNGAGQPLGFVSASFGVATFPEDASTVKELIVASDQGLYIAKENGRNQVSVAGGLPHALQVLELGEGPPN